MEMRPLGRTNLKVSALGLGTMMYGDQIGEADAFAQMDACLDRGINLFDTSELYTVPPKAETWGESERIVGRWMKDRGTREKVVLATKVVGRSKHLPWIREAQVQRLTAPQIKAAVEGSLERLQTDRIDLFQLHWPDRIVPLFGAELRGYRHRKDEFVPFAEILETLAQLRNAGKIRHVGVSNETPWGVMRYVAESDAKDLPRMVSIQNAYNLLNRTFELGLAEVAMREHVGLLAYSPIAQGVLTGKYLDGAQPEGARGTLYGRLNRYETPAAEGAIRDYVRLAKETGVDPAALAMQFVTTRPFVTSNLFGARNPEQLETIFASLDVAWTDDLEKAVNEIHARAPNPCP